MKWNVMDCKIRKVEKNSLSPWYVGDGLISLYGIVVTRPFSFATFDNKQNLNPLSNLCQCTVM